MARLISALAVILAAGLASAQAGGTVKLVFPAEGNRRVWVQSAELLDQIPETVASVGKSVDLPIPAGGKDQAVFVWEIQTGNVATRPLKLIPPGGSWEVQPTDFKYQAQMRFRLESGGEPVATASVQATVGKATRTILVSPESEGEFELTILPVGELKLSVFYQVDGKTRTLPAQTFVAKLNQGEPPLTVIELPVGVETLAAATPEVPKSGVSDGDTPRAESSYGPFANLLNLVVGLALVGGIGYGIFRYVTANREKVDQALKQVGLHADGASPAPPVPEVPKPLQPIVLDQSASGDPVVAGAAAAVKNPRLVSTSGGVLLIPDGEAEIGRENPAPLVIPGEGSVSRRHAKVSKTGESVVLQDLGSTNGTFVNGVKVTSATTLRSGDTVQFGNARFTFEE